MRSKFLCAAFGIEGECIVDVIMNNPLFNSPAMCLALRPPDVGTQKCRMVACASSGNATRPAQIGIM
jgi:hypothetical protein